MITVRGLAFQVLLQLEKSPAHPDQVLQTVFCRHTAIDERDRALLTELVYGVLRWRKRLDWHIDQLSRFPVRKMDPGVRLILRLGVYQILFLDRIPNHAAVNEMVRIAKQTQSRHLVGFVNGVLRSATRHDGSWKFPSLEADPAEYLAVTQSHPRWAVERFIDRLGFEEAERLCRANNQVAPLVIRVNTLVSDVPSVLEELQRQGMDAEASPLLDDAVRIHSLRRDISRWETIQRGWIQVQDEASQWVSRILAPRPGQRVLDLGAGFGGKSTHCAVLMENRGEIVAVDQAAWKLERLRDTAQRQHLDIIRIVAKDISRLSEEDPGTFDCVLLDAPCTGFGVLRRNPDIRWRRSAKDPYRFSRTQYRLLQAAARFVRPGGRLLYATCTLFEDENEGVAERFSRESELRPVAVGAYLEPAHSKWYSGPYFRSWPQRHDMDGFFVALWKRPESNQWSVAA